jgi:hypothetical protein
MESTFIIYYILRSLTTPTNWFYIAGSNSIVDNRDNNNRFVERNTVAADIVADNTAVFELYVRVGDSDRSLVVVLDATDYLDSKGPVPLVEILRLAGH